MKNYNLNVKKQMYVLLGGFFALMCCGNASADGEWTFDTENYMVTDYSGAGGNVEIPAVIEDCKTVILGDSLFYCNSDITGVTVPENCNAISFSSFYDCSNLASVILPETLKVIGEYAFYSCENLTEITIPAAVGVIGDSAFYDCKNLSAVTFTGEVPDFGGGETFSDISEDAIFYVPNDRIEEYSARLPAGSNVQSSGTECTTVSYACPEEDFDFDASTGTIRYYKKFEPIVEIPQTIGGVPVKSIGDNAFNGHRYVYRVDIPEGVESIGDKVFGYANVFEDVNLPSTLKTIGAQAFLGFKGKQIIFPDGLNSIGDEAFRYADIKQLYLGAGIQSIGSMAFSSCSAMKYAYIDAHTPPDIAADAFDSCKALKDIDLYTGCTKDEMLSLQAKVDALGLSCRVWRNQNPDVDYPENDETMTFDGNGNVTGYTGALTHLRPWDSSGEVNTTGIADGAFQGNQVVRYFSACYNDLFTTIGANAFKDSVLETVDLFDSVTTIGAGAFENAPLTTIKGGSAVTSIGERAFANTNLTNFVIPVDIEVAYNAFEGIPVQNLRLSANATDEQVDAWSEALGGQILRDGETSSFVNMPFVPTSEEFFTIDAATGNITGYIGQDVDVVVPREVDGVTVTGIDYNAFECARDYTDTETTGNQTEWVRLRSIILPETVTYIADSAFSYCQQLETFVCYGPTESTGKGTFMLCRSLNNVVFVNGVKVIDNWCFDSAGTLANLYFGRHVDSIGEHAFNLCAMDHFAVDAKAVASNAFSDCPSLTELHFTDRCKTVEAGAVSNCPQLTMVCLETADLTFIPEDGICFGTGSGAMTIRIPADLDEDAKTMAKYVVGWLDPMPEITYVTDTCARNVDMPDVTALLPADSAIQAAPDDAAAPAGE